jgi:hypothetical protein
MATMRLSELTVDMTLYPRLHIDKHRVDLYAKAMQGGVKFPAIAVAKVEGKPGVVIDGVHRFEAHKLLKRGSVEVDDLGEMSRAQAFAEAVRLNAKHGKPLTKHDRLAAYKRLISEGFEVEKAAEIVSIPSAEIKKWRPCSFTKMGGEKVSTRINCKAVRQQIGELKRFLTSGVQKDEDLLDLLDELRTDIGEYLKRDAAVAEGLRELRTLITQAVRPIAQEAAQ